ncbi:MAG: tetratricopeptide repeat protein [Sphingomicrobium sp.]
MKPLRVISAALLAFALIAVAPSAPLFAQRPPPTPEQRLERLERQVQQVQRQVFPKGRPADSAGFSDDPAASQSAVITLDQRLGSLERQMADILRQSEENGNRLRTLESDNVRLRGEQAQRLTALEQRLNEAATVAVPIAVPGPPAAGPKPKPAPGSPPSATTVPGTVIGDPGEDAYTEGFRLFEQGQYDSAITALRAFTSAYPKHRRVSYANNLVGRALLDKGQPGPAAQALLANYRNLPNGERAADSLYYLGQAQLKLGEPSQACRAYGEAEAIYGAKLRADLKKLIADGKTQAQCP